MNFNRPPPPSGAPPPGYTYIRRVYKSSLRPVVIASGSIAALWALLWGIGAFQDISVDKDHAPRLQTFDIVLGSLYIGTCVLELFGVIAAFLRSLPLVRTYSFLSVGIALIVSAAEILLIVIHFAFKSTLINECTALATNQTITTRLGLWFPPVHTTLDADEASQLCNNAWSHDSFSGIAWFIVSAILSLLFAAVAFGYYRELLDPMATRAPRQPGVNTNDNYPLQNYGQSGIPEVPYSRGYQPPQGPPPDLDEDAPYGGAKVPSYTETDAYSHSKDDPFADFDTSTKLKADDSVDDLARRPGGGNV